MKATRTISRRSFLASVGGAAAAGGALLLIAGRGGAAPAAVGDSDFASPVPMGDTFQSDPPPGRQTRLTDRDGGEAFDHVGYGAGTGRTRQEVRAARCTGVRQRLARYESMRPRTAELNGRIATLRPYLGRWNCT